MSDLAEKTNAMESRPVKLTEDTPVKKALWKAEQLHKQL